jgi:hypothetical protein
LIHAKGAWQGFKFEQLDRRDADPRRGAYASTDFPVVTVDLFKQVQSIPMLNIGIYIYINLI